MATNKRDIFHKDKLWDSWKEELTPKFIEDGLTKENSKIVVDYVLHLELRRKAKRTCYEMKGKLRAIFKKFQEKGFKDITKLKEKEVLTFFKEWEEAGHSNDYAVRFKSVWAWYMKEQRKKGVIVEDVCIDLDTSKNRDSQFVWIKKEEGELNQLCELLTEEEQTIVRFVMDSLIRSPTEILSLKVEDITKNNKGEVWVNIPKEISKTIGRRFNLVYTGDSILEHIKKKELKPNDYLFDFSSVYMNRKLQMVAKQIWGDKKSEAGEYYKNLTLYDFRHSGAIFYRKLFKETGQSIDALRHRGGWTNFDIINYYTKLLGMDGKIDKEKMLIGEDKTNLEKEVEDLKNKLKEIEPLLLAVQKIKT